MSARFAVLGNPIAQSKSPQIHQQFAQQFSMQIEYERLLSTDDKFDDDVKRFFANGGVGCNVTAPFKEQAFSACAQLTQAAVRARAANTLMRQDDGSLLGHNSDGVGLVKDIVINKRATIRNRNVMILGAGGATRGILEPIIEEQPKTIIIANRTLSKAQSLAMEFRDIYSITATSIETPDYEDTPDVLINATSASLTASLPVSDKNLLSAAPLCYDLSYSIAPTAFLQWASNLGATRLYDGKGMLVEQAANSFALWTGKEPDTSNAINWLENLS